MVRTRQQRLDAIDTYLLTLDRQMRLVDGHPLEQYSVGIGNANLSAIDAGSILAMFVSDKRAGDPLRVARSIVGE